MTKSGKSPLSTDYSLRLHVSQEMCETWTATELFQGCLGRTISVIRDQMDRSGRLGDLVGKLFGRLAEAFGVCEVRRLRVILCHQGSTVSQRPRRQRHENGHGHRGPTKGPTTKPAVIRPKERPTPPLRRLHDFALVQAASSCRRPRDLQPRAAEAAASQSALPLLFYPGRRYDGVEYPGGQRLQVYEWLRMKRQKAKASD